MTISIYNRKKYDTIIMDIDRETDFSLYANLHKALDNMDDSYTHDEKGKHKYFYTGYDPMYGSMHLGFEVQRLHEEARKATQTYIEEVASFFEVEASFIDRIDFFFF